VVQALIAGFLAGFVGSMPVAGPIAVLVVARSLQNRVREALLIGWGAAVPEAAYAFLAYWGYASFLADVSFLVPLSRGIATAILVFLSYALVRYRPPADPELAPVPVVRGGARSFAMGFTIAALNPTLIVTWTAVLSVVASMDVMVLEKSMALPFSAAAALGMASWCAIAALLVNKFRKRLSQDVIMKVHRVMGVLVFVLAAFFAVAFFQSL